MGLPVFIRTSFVLSGLLGLKLNGIPNGLGGFTAVDTLIPFRMVGPNQLAVSTVNNRHMGMNKLTQQFYYPLVRPVPADNSRDFMRMNSGSSENSLSHPNQEGYSFPKPMKPFSTTKPPSSPTIKPGKAISKCGASAECQNHEVCVSWTKDDRNLPTVSNRRLSKMIYECRTNDGLHYNKMDPMQAKLCDRGQTHSIIYEPQPCLLEDPPCTLVWKYKCVNETDSSHNCKLRKCPSASCVEQIQCGEQPPCRIDTLCLPSYLIHD